MSLSCPQCGCVVKEKRYSTDEKLDILVEYERAKQDKEGVNVLLNYGISRMSITNWKKALQVVS